MRGAPPSLSSQVVLVTPHTLGVSSFTSSYLKQHGHHHHPRTMARSETLLLCLEIASVKTIHIMGTMFLYVFCRGFLPGEIKEAIGTRGDLIRGAWETMCNLRVSFIQVENASCAVTSVLCGKVKNVLEATNWLNTVIAVEIVERSFLKMHVWTSVKAR